MAMTSIWCPVFGAHVERQTVLEGDVTGRSALCELCAT
jgi:hypothetical protein